MPRPHGPPIAPLDPEHDAAERLALALSRSGAPHDVDSIFEPDFFADCRDVCAGEISAEILAEIWEDYHHG